MASSTLNTSQRRYSASGCDTSFNHPASRSTECATDPLAAWALAWPFFGPGSAVDAGEEPLNDQPLRLTDTVPSATGTSRRSMGAGESLVLRPRAGAALVART